MTVPPPEDQVAVFPALDTMRAIASIAVVATHVSFQAGLYDSDLLGTALSRLDVGVAIFFVLSGFLLSRPFLLRERLGLPAPSVAKYFWKRSLRILPVYLVVVVAALAFLPGNGDASVTTWVQNLTLTDVYLAEGLPRGLTQMWSLAAEVAFYLALPFLLLAGRRRRGRSWRLRRLPLLLAALVLLNWTWSIASATETLGMTTSGLKWLPTFMTWFCVGIAFALAQTSGTLDGHSESQTSTLSRIGKYPGTCWAGALSLFLIACTPVAGPALLFLPTAQEAVTKNVLYAGIAGLLILPGIFASTSTTFCRVMSWPPLRHLGHTSYSLFCCHLIVLAFVMEWREIELFTGRGLELFVLTLGGSLFVSELLYRLVEKPFLNLKDAFRGPTKTSPTSIDRASATQN